MYLGHLTSIRHKQIRCALPLSQQRIVVSSYGENAVVLYARDETGYYPSWAAQVHRPRGICADDTFCYVACFGDPLGSVTALNLCTGAVRWNVACPRPRGIDMDGDQLVVTQVATGRISIHEPKTGAEIQTLPMVVKSPRGIALVKPGVYVVAESDARRVSKLSRTKLLQSRDDLPHCNDVACHGASIAVSLWYVHSVVLLRTEDLSRLLEIRVPGPNRGLAMLRMTAKVIFVGDDRQNRVHVLRY